jgi:FAD/FMN-containing dehydrogenase
VLGHLAAGNLHVNVLDGSDDLDDAILRLVADHRGSIPAEHGIGTAKARYLPLTSTAAASTRGRRSSARSTPPASSTPG